MLPRWLTILIVLVWLLFSGRLLILDLVPRLLPGQPPPYTIDLVEEARTQRTYVDWIVQQGGQRLFRAHSRILHPEHDVFELTAEFKPLQKGTQVPLHGMLVSRMSSMYRVNGNGDLLGVAVEIEGTPQLIRFWSNAEVNIHITGMVHDRQLKPLLSFGQGKHHLREIALPEVHIRQGGSVLLPMHPFNRLLGIRPGQRWQMTVLDPVGDSLAAWQGGGGELRLLRAHVRPEVEAFNQGRRQDVPCLVIDYEGDDLQASTWVDERTGLVLCQEATFGNETWVMYRE